MYNFRKVSTTLYRGSAPSVRDLKILKKLGIKKIVSLDKEVGNRIHRAAILLGFNHIILPIDITRRITLINFLNKDIVRLFDKGGPTFIHCLRGKDRTGLAVAIYRCEKQGWSCGRAIKEAESLGFGIGVDPRIIKLYKKIINKSCGCSEKDLHDVSYAYDIVSNEREYPTSYNDYDLGVWQQGSWSPYLDYRTEQWPFSNQEISWPEQYQNRQNYGLDDRVPDSSKNYDNGFPQVGQWDTNTQGISGSGPSFVGSGFI